MFRALLITLSCALFVAAAPLRVALHDNSWSQSLVVVQHDQTTVFLRVQALSAIELPGVDSNADAWLDGEELDAARDVVLAHLESAWALRPSASDQGSALALELTRFELVEEAQSALDLQRFVEAEWRWEGAPPEVLRLDMQLFADTSPMHIDTCRVTWPDGSFEDARTWAGKPFHRFARPASDASGSAGAGQPAADADATGASARDDNSGTRGSATSPAFLDDLHLGVEHMLTGWDHLAFLLGLLAVCAGRRALLGVITAFTLAHSLTLTLAAYDLLRLPSGPVELGIAVSIAYVGALALFSGRPRTLWIEAGVFGLVHGLGFASQIARQLTGSASPLQLLLGFNLGLELGQLAVVLALLGVLALLRQRGEVVDVRVETAVNAASERAPLRARPTRWLLPRKLRKLAALCVLLGGLWWSYERVAALGLG
ncbi:MAG: hypothetical protein DHS20C15_19520 [Planctomycetota bacterium]|nr:MAG: hypothetical protein DHS20C15_19520 [Planctomycetota bacterium]